MNFLKIIDKCVARISPWAFILLTFFIIIFRVPFSDEAWAFMVSRLSFFEIFQITRMEGHPLLWYYLLKPFSFNLNLYPYSMLLLNWVISSILILFIWKKAPFNNLIKFLITFSYPFLHYFGVIARPYTLGVLVIFLLAYFYKNSTKKPLLYSFLIVLCANISIITCFGAIAFGVLFLIDIFKNKILTKKQLTMVFLILFFGAIFFLSQFVQTHLPELRSSVFINQFKLNFLHYSGLFFYKIQGRTIFEIIFYFLSSTVLFSSLIFFFKRNKKAIAFYFIPVVLMTYMFINIYIGALWHYFFYFIYFLALIWMFWDEIDKNKTYKILITVLLAFSLLPQSFVGNKIPEEFDTRTYKTMYDIIMNDDELKQSKLFCLDWFYHFCPGLLPYFKRENIVIYDINGKDRTSFESAKNIQLFRETYFYGSDFIEHLDKNRNNYLITQDHIFSQGFRAQEAGFRPNGFYYEDDKVKIFFEIKKYYPNIPFSIYKINVLR